MGLMDISFWGNYKNIIEAQSGGRNTVVFDDQGLPSVMVRIPAFSVEDVDADLGTGSHPAFLVDTAQISHVMVGMYQAYVHNNRAYSLPYKDPTASISFDNSLLRCGDKGPGWHLMTNAEWAAIAMLSHALGADAAHGNTYYGRDYSSKTELGLRQDDILPGTASGTARTLTGSGPASWRHDGTLAGVSDLVGNVWEWVGGMRLVDGEIQVLADNDAALDRTGAAHHASTGDWQAILEDGSLVAPGTTDTLKYDASGATGSGNPVLSNTVTSQSDGTTAASQSYKDLTASVTPPDIVKVLGLFPHEIDMNRGILSMRNIDERLPLRGGHWAHAAAAGLFALHLHNARSYLYTAIGFRPAYIG